MLRTLQDILDGEAEHAVHRLWSDQLSEAEAAAIQRRAQRDPRYRDELRGLRAACASMEGLADDVAIQEVAWDYRQLLQKHRARRRVALGIAAGALLAVSTILSYYPPWGGADAHLQKYFTRIGEQRTIELDDGSVMTLNTAGRVVVDYGAQARRVSLERGEVYFEVAKDSPRPFTVDLGLRAVTAVGTAFNVRKDAERYQVAVVEGAVMLHEATEDISALPQQVLIGEAEPHRVEAGWVAELDLSSERLTVFQPESIEHYRDWRSGLLGFYDEPLSRVVRELNRYSRKRILIEDTSIMELTVFTVVRVTDIDTALHGLEQVLPIDVTRHYDMIVINSSAENGNEEH